VPVRIRYCFLGISGTESAAPTFSAFQGNRLVVTHSIYNRCPLPNVLLPLMDSHFLATLQEKARERRIRSE